MPQLPPTIVVSGHHLLLLFLVFSITAMALDDNIQQPKFREAPQFYNSHGCPPPLLPSSTDCPSSALVHVAMTLDVAYLRGSIAAIHSVLKHTSCPQSIRFHLVASTSIDRLSSTIASSFPSLSFKVYPFDGAPIAGLISASVREALDRPLNYARSYLADILPSCVGRVVYLDSDLVVVDDIQSLAATSLGGGEVLAAPEHCKANFTAYFTRAFWGNAALSGAFAGRRACYFNTGVMVMDLGRWRAGGHTWRIEDWMRLQRRMRIYELGSLPPFLLEFAGRIAAIDDRWNQHGLGGDNYRGRCRDLHPGPVSLLHWSGKGKPWARIDAGRPCPLDALWAPYDLLLRAHPIGES